MSEIYLLKIWLEEHFSCKKLRIKNQTLTINLNTFLNTLKIYFKLFIINSQNSAGVARRKNGYKFKTKFTGRKIKQIEHK